ncbi:hypothetical protein N0V95_003578 [Ascochyta clinopodiicola]|nr:hypothetical protein N0V95_003578 [Ascochyta clinopodiicola]
MRANGRSAQFFFDGMVPSFPQYTIEIISMSIWRDLPTIVIKYRTSRVLSTIAIHPSLTTRPNWDAFGAARLSGRQAPKRAGVRQPLECVVGRVVLLPGQQLIPTTSVVHSQARSSPWDHPQVITKTWDDENGVRFVKLRTCTSFGGEGIARKKEHQRHYFVEADGSQLTHESDTFSKQTYVNCSPGAELTIEFEHLASWPGSARNPIQFSPAAVVGFDKCEHYRRDSCN